MPIILLCLATSLLSPALTANEQLAATKAEQRLAIVRDKINLLQNDLLADQSTQTKLQLKLRAIEIKINNTDNTLRNLLAKIGTNKTKLNNLHDELAKLFALQQSHTHHLAQQLRTSYTLGKEKKLKIILNLDAPSLVNRMLVYLNYFNKSRSQAINQLRQLQQQKQILQQAINSQVARLKKQRTRLVEQQQVLKAQYHDKELVLNKIAGSIQQKGSTISQLQQDEQALTKIIKQLRHVLADIPSKFSQFISLGQRRGQLTWPVAGRADTKYRNKGDDTKTKYNGIIIAAKVGQKVKSVHSGRVAFADWLRGFGLLLIIDHGDGYMTLYAHNRSIYKEVGDWVDINDVIASVGNSGGAATTGLYFEIRHNGQPINPLAWLKRIG